ncbi:hypothetical protein [Vibrio antiquarius]|uniref:hypothetical protein n=1 Tax=Vibrio antiquarius (strain Ex25) TaxID=150340 RepID=UPI001D40866B|nr:hypothetical protein [Vibrio antiquarius]EGQ9298915.1 hypothetical protein [Vibrio parahaemolyticus]EGR0686953.1 hypothetical protein [Vibrio parahaemolyticus]MCR9845876.1 hypothetical protein [Vibrio antiquarius]MCR9911353.1 hypothetical protein [Vibrio antiquarius]
MSDRTDNRPEVDMKTILEERAESGSPIKVIEVGATTQDAVDALQRLLPEDQKQKVSLVNLSEKLD